MQQHITKIGKGQKTWKDLTWEEAKQVMRLLIEGQATLAQIGAFLLAMRLKMESVAELAAFTAAAREYVSPLSVTRQRPLVDLPLYAGKQETFHAALASAIIVAAAGVNVLVHGYDDVPGRPGVAALLGRLGIPADLGPAAAAQALSSKGFAYLDLALYHPPLARFLDLRKELGLRNVFHPIAKMLNPARAGAQVIGVSHPPYLEKTAEALMMLGSRRALVLRGVEGEPELSMAALTKLLEVKDERIYPLSLQPRDFGMPMGTSRDMAGFPAEQLDQEAALLRRILRNEQRGGQRDWVVLNAAMLLYVAGSASSITAALAPAQRTLESGEAARKLDELTSATQTTAV